MAKWRNWKYAIGLRSVSLNGVRVRIPPWLLKQSLNSSKKCNRINTIPFRHKTLAVKAICATKSKRKEKIV